MLKPMKAVPYEERRLTDPKFGWAHHNRLLMQPKLDGWRIWSSKNDLRTYTGGLYYFLGHIEKELYAIRKRFGEVSLDGELYKHGMDFSLISSIGEHSIRGVNPHKETCAIEMHVHDVIDLSLPAAERARVLAELAKMTSRDLSYIKVVSTWEIPPDPEEVIQKWEIFESMGYEGFILRKPNAFYRPKRSVDMLKFKPKKTDIYPILAANEAIDKDGVPKGMLGSFVCAGLEGEQFNCSAGRLTAKQRKELWEKQSLWQGKSLLIAYQNLTHGKQIPRGGGFAIKVI